ncbi:MAG TPA: hypothetical protein VM012_12100, partial [Flavitalea sp.]|nr:hypothetical protein [Flavitalea sp.]
MKRFNLYFLLVLMVAATGCIKNEEVVYKRNAVVEFDAATWNSKAAGVNFPILTRVPPYGRAVNTPDPAITRASGTIKLRVNLVGPQFSEDK